MSFEDPAIRVENLSKCFQIYRRPHDRLKQSILPRLRSLFGRETGPYYREFWALKDVSFDVASGETVGIVGRNGSGKSTLLQMIYGTLEPSSGSVETLGRVAALLELGAGFNPEFTGRENVYMNATVLGMTQDEIRARFNEIVVFADIGEFIEQPVKHYSSGMYARLAFAIAINVDPRILIVDEALAVGDEPFQRKCFARMEEIKRSGGTILFVSHASSSIIDLCDRAILLHDGESLFVGKPKKAIAWYQKLMNAPSEQWVKIREAIQQQSSQNDVGEGDLEARPDGTSAVASGKNIMPQTTQEDDDDEGYSTELISKSRVVYEPNGVEITDVRIETLGKQRRVNSLVKGRRYRICYEVEFYMKAENVRFNSIIKTVKGVELGGGTYPTMGSNGISIEENRAVKVFIEFDCNLRTGTYFINCGVASNTDLLHRIIDAEVFHVTGINDDSAIGVVDFGCSSFVRERLSANVSVVN